MNRLQQKFERLAALIEGELKYDNITRTIYSTDASAFKEMPVAVAWPKGEEDIIKILRFAATENIPLTVRAAGTSLAGQVVGNGIIVDISRHMTGILEINTDERWVMVEPGIVLDELNIFLKQYGLFFGPETSTSNRCNIGGMVGNNACGSHSIIYGSTREHTLEIRAILSDSSVATFGPVSSEVFDEKCSLDSLEGKIYRNIREILSDKENIKSIRDEFPDPNVPRRNTGYALDMLMDSNLFSKESGREFNFSNLLTGSEGTLAITTRVKLNLVPLPPPKKALVCVHLEDRIDSFKANLIALKYKPSAVELMDDRILELTKGNISQNKNRFFLEGQPGAILIVEFSRDSEEEIDRVSAEMTKDLKANGYGYAFPVIKGNDISKVWDLRKAGLGVLSNMKGDSKPVSLIEDTAVNVQLLPEYIADFEKTLLSLGKDCVYHAHIGTGEIHIRPVLNLKDPGDVELFRKIGIETARIVRKYRGSMSGEHGDGRLRGEFIPIIIGERNYSLLKKIKECWDPQKLLNPGKITDTVPMNTFLRYVPGQVTANIPTYYDFSSTDGIIRAAEACNGSGDCRKSHMIGGLMCPSYMATREEKNTTRARANILREFLSNEDPDPWDHKEIYEILDLCLSCKGCKSECPSSVDVAKMKSEFLQHWYDKNGVPLRPWLIANLPSFNSLGAILPGFYNFFLSNSLISGVIKRVTGFAQSRSIPLLAKTTLRRWIRQNPKELVPGEEKGKIYLFIDEFTNFNDTEVGIKAIRLFRSLGYEIKVVKHESSARTYISKGFIRKAKKIARKNIEIFSPLISKDQPLVGIEPSAILGFRDEYPELCGPDLRDKAFKLAENCLLADEFIARELRNGKIRSDNFNKLDYRVMVHTHCQQKSIASSSSLIEALGIPEASEVEEIPSGCCGMAGSFGYEKEHFDLSNKIGELILFPEIRNATGAVRVVAPGTSCRHHIKDGTGTTAFHPVEILYDALKK